MSKRQLKVYIDTEFKETSLANPLQGAYAVQPISVGCFIPEFVQLLHYTYTYPTFDINHQWLQENVMPKLSQSLIGDLHSDYGGELSQEHPKAFFGNLMSRNKIDELLIISDISGSDSCVFRQFFGGYFELEKLAPIDTIDLYSIAYARGILDEVKAYRKSLIDERYIHNALFDAWLVYKIDEKFQLTPTISHA